MKSNYQFVNLLSKKLPLILSAFFLFTAGNCKNDKLHDAVMVDSTKLRSNVSATKTRSLKLPDGRNMNFVFDSAPCQVTSSTDPKQPFSFTIAGNCSIMLSISTTVTPATPGYTFNIGVSRHGFDGIGSMENHSGISGIIQTCCTGPAHFIVTSEMISPAGVPLTPADLIITHSGADSLVNKRFDPDPTVAVQVNGNVQYQLGGY